MSHDISIGTEADFVIWYMGPLSSRSLVVTYCWVLSVIFPVVKMVGFHCFFLFLLVFFLLFFLPCPSVRDTDLTASFCPHSSKTWIRSSWQLSNLSSLSLVEADITCISLKIFEPNAVLLCNLMIFDKQRGTFTSFIVNNTWICFENNHVYDSAGIISHLVPLKICS